MLTEVIAAQDAAELADHHQPTAIEDGHIVPGHVFFLTQAQPALAIVMADQQRTHLTGGDGQAARSDTHAVELVGDLRTRHIGRRLPETTAIQAEQHNTVVADRHGMAAVPCGDVLQSALGRRGQAA
ncbi:hypothetical protein D3C84_1027350 [compost metagenome]